MQNNEKRGTMFCYREEEKHRIIADDLKEHYEKYVEVTAPAMQKVSPILILDYKGNCVHPLISVNTDKSVFSKQIQSESNLVSKFEKKDLIQEKHKAELEEIEIAKPEDKDSERRHLDKYNLTKAFVLAHDPLEQFEFKANEDYDEVELKYENLNDKLDNIFGIKIN